MDNMHLTGIIPAAGYAKRLSPIPCSKELLPVGLDEHHKRLNILSEHLIEGFRQGDIKKAFFIVREGKWDIPQYYQNGAGHGIHLGYLFRAIPYGVPYTLYEALDFVADDPVAMGFPDIIFKPLDAYVHLRKAFNKEKPDLMIGLFPVKDKSQWDMVEVDEKGKITDIQIKPKNSSLQYAWCIAIWNSFFSTHLKESVLNRLKTDPYGRIEDPPGNYRELIFSDIIKSAIGEGLNVKGLAFQQGFCLDAGSYPNLFQLLRKQNSP
jgi:glucose-1-phosphate thymidylyltransferase